MSITPPPSEHDERLERVLADYLHAVEAGTPPDRAELLRRHPDLAADLDSFFRNRDAMERMAGPIKEALPETIGATSTAGVGAVIGYFGDYELLGEIARGGMGVVYRARQVSLNRIVAVKMILAGQLASAADVARFRTEAEAAAKLDHPNIVPIYEIGEHGGQHYFSMKFIDGGRLAVDRRSTLRGADFRSAAKRVAIVARAVHHAHQRGILHRDLKPGNILIDADGEPHVTDFGLAKRVEGGSDLTRSGAIVGTPGYMAPEQARSEKELTTAVDVYSLGAILYEWLTERPPFRADTPLETLMQVVEREPPRPRALNPHVPRDLETICLKCLDKDPRRRYGSAEALADDLDRWLASEPIRARQTPAWERTIKWARRRPALAALVLVSTIATLLLVAGLLWSNASIRAEEERTRDALAHARAEAAERAKAEAKALAAWDNERRAAYANRVALAYAEWHAQHADLAAFTLDRCPPELRDWEWQYLSHLCRPEVFRVPSWGLGVAYSPDGRFLVTGASDGALGVWIFDAATGKLTGRLSGLTSNPCRFAVSADGRVVAAAACRRIGGGDAKVWDVATGKVLFSISSPRIDHMALSPDGQYIYISEGTGENPVSGYTVADGKKFLSIADPDGRSCNPIALSPDGKRLAVAYEIFDALTGKKLVTCARRAGGITQLAFSPDGKRLAAADDPVILWDAVTGKQLWAVPANSATALAFSPDSRRLAVGVKNDLRMLAVDTGREIYALHSLMGREVTGVAFHPSGKRMAVSGVMNEPAKVLDVDTREVYTIKHRPHDLAENGWEPHNLAFSPDGRSAASIAAGATTVRIFDLIAAKEVGVVHVGKDRPGDRFMRLAYRKDGHLLALCTTTAKDSTHGLVVRDLTAKRLLFAVRERGLADIGESVSERWVDLSGDGSRLAVALRSSQEAELWDTDEGKIVGRLAKGSYRGGVLNVSPDGQRLLVMRMQWSGPPPAAGPGAIGVQLYDAATGKLVLAHASTAFDFSPDGRRIAIFDKDNVTHYDAATGQEQRTLADVGIGQSFSPDSRRLATTRGVWDTGTGERLCSWELNLWAGGVFNPDGRRLAVRGNGLERNQVEIWETQTGHHTLTLRGLNRPISRLYFSRDGHRLMAIDDSAIHIWNAAPSAGD